MEKREFIERLSAAGIPCTILDECVINPNEIILFTSKKNGVRKFMTEYHLDYIVQDNGINRVIRIVTYREYGIGEWERSLQEKGTPIAESIVKISEEDSHAIFLYYAYVYVQTKNWLYYNILYELKVRLGMTKEHELERWLAKYLQERGYGIKVNKIVELPPALSDMLTPMRKGTYFLNQMYLKVVRRVIVSILKIGGRWHNLATRQRYINYLKKTAVLGETWSVINKEGIGASGCTLVKDVRTDATYFIKGNELSVYQGLKNEISMQKLLMQGKKQATWFLPMLDYDVSGRWIRYEFMPYEMLSRYTQDYKFSVATIELLGNYLIKVLDELYDKGIVHNDMRSENIMVKKAKDGTIEGFLLTDFGCSSFKESIPWNQKGFWGRYLARVACGKMRYNEKLIDDAATAWLLYLSVGGKENDVAALEIKKRIGRIYFSL